VCAKATVLAGLCYVAAACETASGPGRSVHSAPEAFRPGRTPEEQIHRSIPCSQPCAGSRSSGPGWGVGDPLHVSWLGEFSADTMAGRCDGRPAEVYALAGLLRRTCDTHGGLLCSTHSTLDAGRYPNRALCRNRRGFESREFRIHTEADFLIRKCARLHCLHTEIKMVILSSNKGCDYRSKTWGCCVRWRCSRMDIRLSHDIGIQRLNKTDCRISTPMSDPIRQEKVEQKRRESGAGLIAKMGSRPDRRLPLGGLKLCPSISEKMHVPAVGVQPAGVLRGRPRLPRRREGPDGRVPSLARLHTPTYTIHNRMAREPLLFQNDPTSISRSTNSVWWRTPAIAVALVDGPTTPSPSPATTPAPRRPRPDSHHVGNVLVSGLVAALSRGQAAVQLPRVQTTQASLRQGLPVQ
jgi:hypothetical protein